MPNKPIPVNRLTIEESEDLRAAIRKYQITIEEQVTYLNGLLQDQIQELDPLYGGSQDIANVWFVVAPVRVKPIEETGLYTRHLRLRELKSQPPKGVRNEAIKANTDHVNYGSKKAKTYNRPSIRKCLKKGSKKPPEWIVELYYQTELRLRPLRDALRKYNTIILGIKNIPVPPTISREPLPLKLDRK